MLTQASGDRLPAIEAMAMSWGGVLCVAIYVRGQAELQELYPRLCSLHERIEAKRLCRLNICVATEEGVLSDESALYPVSVPILGSKLQTYLLVILKSYPRCADLLLMTVAC